MLGRTEGNPMKEQVAQIVVAYFRKNSVAPSDVPAVIAQVYQSLIGITQPLPAEPDPAVPIRRSVNPEYIACLECGAKATLLRPHLANAHNLMPADYRERWNLPSDYPMVAPRYAARRSEWARAAGLGRKHGKGGEASKRASSR
jgi:predicted transcriptional regulator